MANHWCIIKDLGSPTLDVAHLDVTHDDPATNVTFNVWANGVAAPPIDVALTNCFASSPNLFASSGNKTALVRVVAAQSSAAMLRGFGNVGTSIPPEGLGVGTAFALSTNNTTGLTLLIGNTDQGNTPANITVCYGDPTSPAGLPAPQQFTVEATQVKVFSPASCSKARITLRVDNQVPVVVQALALGPSGAYSFVVPPLA